MDPLDPLNLPPSGDFSIELPSEPEAVSPAPAAETAAPAAAPVKTEFEASCLEALSAFGKTVTQLGLYGPEHPSVLETMQGAQALIVAALKGAPQGALVYAKDQDKWIVNRRIIGTVKQIGGPVSVLIDRYKLSSVTFREGLEIREMIVICQLASLPYDQKVDAKQYLHDAGVKNIVLSEAVYAEVGADGKPAAKGDGKGGDSPRRRKASPSRSRSRARASRRRSSSSSRRSRALRRRSSSSSS
ncbi:MAG: hypothetical protein M0D55_15015 [Elusimicrobiota bacterium]|nr:MAG: hypothetical protein M0D55_15015 [Elusimicrobiota bacterium]